MSTPVPKDIPGARLGVPRWAACQTARGKMTRSRRPARVPPTSWAMIYRIPSRGAIRLVTRNPMVTAGLRCPPEVAPKMVIMIESASPCANAMPSNPIEPCVKVLVIIEPAPRKMKAKLPTSSATTDLMDCFDSFFLSWLSEIDRFVLSV